MKKKIIAMLLALLLTALLIAGCGQGDDTPANGGQADAETTTDPGTDNGDDAPPAATGRDSVIINTPADIDNLDPAYTASSSDFRIFRQIFSRLVDEDETGFVPSVAHSWELSEDGLTYTFFLRDDVLFHNGDPLTASDVVFTFERAMESPFVAAPLAPIAAVTAVDDHTVQMDLHHEFAPLFAAIQNAWIVPERAVTEAGDAFGRNPVGSGPFMFEEHQPGRSIQLTRFDDYFGGPAAIRDVTFMVILNPATTSIAMEAGDIDMGIFIPPGDFERLEALPDLQVTYFDVNSLNFLALNSLAPPFDNLLVRQAVAHVVDRQSIITMAAEGLGRPANGFLTHMTFGYCPNVTPLPHDVERARELLAEAGYPEGFETTLITIGGGEFEGIAQILQNSLAAIGITVRIEMMEQGAFLGDLLGHNYEMAVLAIALGIDASDWAMIFTSEGGMNMSGLTDANIDRLFEEAAVSTDPAVRIAAYAEIAQWVNDTAGIIPLYFMQSAYVHSANLQLGWISATAVFRLHDMYWTD